MKSLNTVLPNSTSIILVGSTSKKLAAQKVGLIFYYLCLGVKTQLLNKIYCDAGKL